MRRIRVLPPDSFVLTTAQSPIDHDPDLYFHGRGLTQADVESRARMLQQMQQLIVNDDDPDVWLFLRNVLEGASQRELSHEAGVNFGTLCRRFQAQRARLIADSLAIETVKHLARERSCAFRLPQLTTVDGKLVAKEGRTSATRLRCACSQQAITAALTSSSRPLIGRRQTIRQALLGGIAVAFRCHRSNDILVDLHQCPSTVTGRNP